MMCLLQGSPDNTGLMAASTSAQQQLQPEVRRTGTVAAATQASPSLSWTAIARFVRQLEEQTSLTMFCEAVARHVYSSTGVHTKAGRQSAMQQTPGSLHHLKFWQADLLAGLLMQAVMVIGKNFAGPSLLQCMVRYGANIATDTGALSSRWFNVPAASTASEASTRWLALFWNMLYLAIAARDAAALGQGSSDALVSLTVQLAEAFAYNGAEASKNVKKKALLFWQTDCLAQALLQALQSYVSSGHAKVDALTIQEFLVQQTNQPTHQSASQAHDNPQDRPPADLPKPVDAVTLAAAFAELQDGTGVHSLARLEQRLLHHFQVLKPFLTKVIVAICCIRRTWHQCHDLELNGTVEISQVISRNSS